MRNDVQKLQGAVPRNGRGNGFFSLRTYLRIVSSGASTVASTVRSAGASVASSIAERYEESIRDQVHWAGFDKVESDNGVLRQVLLLAYQYGFQVWDVEEADDVHQLASKHDGPVSFLQIQKKPISSKKLEDRFADFRPLLVVVEDISFSGGGNNVVSISSSPSNGSADLGGDNRLPIAVRFYSIRSHEYVHALKFRTVVYSVRCSPRVVAISQASQIHCFNAGTLEKEYTILTYPVVSGYPGSSSIGYGPLAVGPRWLAYSGAPVTVPNTNRVSPQHLPSSGLSSSSTNGSLVAHYAKESSKQLAAGIVTLGDMGYKKLSKYYSDLMPDANGSIKAGNSNFKANGTLNGHIPDMENCGMVIVRDIVSKYVVVQFRAHKSPISALCFDPSGTLLVTASIHGHNINVFHIMPSTCSSSSALSGTGSSVHLYRLQRGITNAVIQDISFSDDSQCIMISSSRGTSHLFAISPFGGMASIQYRDVNCPGGSYRTDTHHPQSFSAPKQNHLNSFSGPITLSVVSRIKNGNNGWKGALTGAAAAASGKVNTISGGIASAFHNCKASSAYLDANSFRTKYYLLLFSPSGCIIQYVLRQSSGEDLIIDLSGSSAVSHGLSLESDSRFVVEPLQKWDICHKRNRRDRIDNMDVYSEQGENAKLFQKMAKKVNSVYPTDDGPDVKMKLSAEENHHLYISEVELQMDASQVPLWTRPGISFHLMMDDTIEVDDSSLVAGEIEIEKLSYQTVEVRSEDLKPVLDFLQRSKSRQLSSSNLDTSRIGLLMNQKSGSSEVVGTLSRRSSCSSFDPMPDSPVPSELNNGADNNYFGSFEAATEANGGFVNTANESPLINHQLEHVNSREDLNMEARLEHVNSKESLLLETYPGDVHNAVS